MGWNWRGAVRPPPRAVTIAEVPGNARLGWLQETLGLLRGHLGMDVAFLAQFAGRRRVLRLVSSATQEGTPLQVGDSDPLEDTLCLRIADGRLPAVLGDALASPEAAALRWTRAAGARAYLAVPVLMQDGAVYGTLTCFSRTPRPELGDSEASTLRSVAKLFAAAIEAESEREAHPRRGPVLTRR